MNEEFSVYKPAVNLSHPCHRYPRKCHSVATGHIFVEDFSVAACTMGRRKAGRDSVVHWAKFCWESLPCRGRGLFLAGCTSASEFSQFIRKMY